MKEPIFGTLAEALLSGFNTDSFETAIDENGIENHREPRAAYEEAKAELLALRESGWDVASDVERYVPKLIGKWIELDNPTFIDQALLICLEHRFPIIDCLAEHLKDVCYRRCSSIPFAARQTAKSAENSSYDYQVHLWLANLHAAGVKARQASLVAANLFQKKFPSVEPYKASYLQKSFHQKMTEYSDNGIRLDVIAKEQHARNPDFTGLWLNIASQYSDCPPELIGLRGNENDIGR
jgi:hypothetical protein